MSERVKIVDVAKAAGVSPATVSKVFNPEGSASIKVSDGTRKRVQDAASKLNYSPNYGAKLLRGKKTFTVGFASEHDPETEGYIGEYSIEILNGLKTAASKEGYHILLVNDCDYLSHFETGRIDALAIGGYYKVFNPSEMRTLSSYELMKRTGRPFVIINGTYSELGYNCVCVDNDSGIDQALELISRKGYEKVGFIGELGSNPQAHHMARERRLKAGLLERGLSVNPALFIHGPSQGLKALPRSGNYVYSDGYEGMRVLHERGLDADCVVCGNDTIAFGAMKFCHERGIAIPKRLAVIGFDDIPMASFSNPALTTVAQPLRELGARAFASLMESIANPGRQPRRELLKATLVERDSA